MKRNQLKYSFHWNSKLLCPVHTTIRLRNDRLYYVGAQFDEYLNGAFMGTVEIIEVKTLLLHQINNYIAGLDTGYMADECKEMIRKMYKNRVTDWNTQQLSFILLRKIDK